jgi:hypothetical protein
MTSTNSSLLHRFSLEVITSTPHIQNELHEFGLRFGIPVLFRPSLEVPVMSDVSSTKRIVLVPPECNRGSLLDGVTEPTSQHDALIVCITDDEAEALLKKQKIPRGLSLLVSPFAPLELYCLLQTIARSFPNDETQADHHSLVIEKREPLKQTFPSDLSPDFLNSTALWMHSALTHWSHRSCNKDCITNAILDEGYAQAALLSSYHAAYVASAKKQSEECKVFDLLQRLRDIYARRAQYRGIDYILHISGEIPETLSLIKPALEALLVLVHEHLFEVTSQGKIIVEAHTDYAQNVLKIQLSDQGTYSLVHLLKNQDLPTNLPHSIVSRVEMIRSLLTVLQTPELPESQNIQALQTIINIPFSPVQQASSIESLPPLQLETARDELAVVFLAIADRSTRDTIQADLASRGIHSICCGTYGQTLEAYRHKSTVGVILDFDNPLLDYRGLIMHAKQYGLGRKVFGLALQKKVNLSADLSCQCALVGTTIKEVVEAVAQIVSGQERIVPLFSVDSGSAVVLAPQNILQQPVIEPQIASSEPQPESSRSRSEEFELSGPSATELVLCELDLSSPEVRKVIENYVTALSHDLSELSLMIRQQKWQQLKRVAAEQAKTADTNGFSAYAKQLRDLQAAAEKRDYRSATTLLFELRTLSKLMERGFY